MERGADDLNFLRRESRPSFAESSMLVYSLVIIDGSVEASVHFIDKYVLSMNPGTGTRFQ